MRRYVSRPILCLTAANASPTMGLITPIYSIIRTYEAVSLGDQTNDQVKICSHIKGVEICLY